MVIAPPLEEQRRIADFLDDQTTRIDRLIEARKMQTALLKEMWQSDLDSAYSLQEHSTRLAHFARVQTGITLNAGRVADATVEIPYLRVANVQAGRIDLREIKHVQATPEQIARHSVRLGDVLMTEGGDLDKLGRGTVWDGQIDSVLHQNHVFAVRTKRDLLVPEYLAFYTESTRARAYFEVTGSRSTNLASTSATKVLDLPVPVVAPLEQEAILARLRSTRSGLDEQSLALELSTRVLRELKRSLISAAVSGDFDVSSANGNRVVV
jgi:type I restriction enzyme S subunit